MNVIWFLSLVLSLISSIFFCFQGHYNGFAISKTITVQCTVFGSDGGQFLYNSLYFGYSVTNSKFKVCGHTFCHVRSISELHQAVGESLPHIQIVKVYHFFYCLVVPL